MKKSFKQQHCKQMGAEPVANLNLMRLVDGLMSADQQEDAPRVSFDRVKIEGRNAGSSMRMNRGSRESPAEVAGQDQPDPNSINIYISNNIQGVTGSILVGSEVRMAEPGLRLAFGDISWDRDPEARRTRETGMYRVGTRQLFSPMFWLNALGVLVCGFALVLSFYSTLVSK